MHLHPIALMLTVLDDAVAAAGGVLEKAYQVVMVREVYGFVRDVLVALGLGHVLHLQHRRLRRAANAYRRRRRSTKKGARPR